MGTWAAGGGGPCDEASFDAYDAGWKGVMCCASYDGVTCDGANAGRVTWLGVGHSHSHSGVSGDIGPLGRLAELRYLDLRYTAVAGDVAALATLGQLQTLWLYSSAVWGRADALRAIPGLGADWNYFTACAAGGNAYYTAADFGQCPAGRSPFADGASYLGADECACCSGSLKMRDPTTGACVDPNGESPPATAQRTHPHTRARQIYLRAPLPIPRPGPASLHCTRDPALLLLAELVCCVFSLVFFTSCVLLDFLLLLPCCPSASCSLHLRSTWSQRAAPTRAPATCL